MPYLTVARVGNKFRELVNDPSDLAAAKNLRDYKRYAIAKAEKPDTPAVVISPETTALVARLVEADKARITAHDSAREASFKEATEKNAVAAKEGKEVKEVKPYTPSTPKNYKDIEVMIKLVGANIYRNTKDFNTSLAGLLTDILNRAVEHSVSCVAADAKTLDFANSFAVANVTNHIWNSLENFSVAPDMEAKLAANNHENVIKAMFKSHSSLSVKKELVRQVNNLVSDLIGRCAEYARVLSAYNNKQTLTKNTAIAITQLLHKDSLEFVNNFETFMAAEDKVTAEAKEAKKAAPKTPRAPKAAAAAPVAATPVAVATTPVAVATTPVAGKGKGKGKTTATAPVATTEVATPAAVAAPVAPANPAVSTLLAAATASSTAPAGKGKGKGKGKTA